MKPWWKNAYLAINCYLSNVLKAIADEFSYLKKLLNKISCFRNEVRHTPVMDICWICSDYFEYRPWQHVGCVQLCKFWQGNCFTNLYLRMRVCNVVILFHDLSKFYVCIVLSTDLSTECRPALHLLLWDMKGRRTGEKHLAGSFRITHPLHEGVSGWKTTNWFVPAEPPSSGRG